MRVTKLFKKYDTGTVAISNTNFGVNNGEIFGLLGPNGAGKSTTFNILTSLIPRTYGSIIMKNREVNRADMEIY